MKALVYGATILLSVNLCGQTNSGPDTVDDVEKIGRQGNWMKKREWLMQANEVNKQIQELAAQAETIREKFIKKHQQIDAELDTFYKGIGLEQGKILELFDSIYRYLEKKRKKEIAAIGTPVAGEKPDPEMQAKIDVIEAKTKEETQKLEQLNLDMKSVGDLGQSLIDRIRRLNEFLNNIQESSNKAKNIINDLWDIIDHNMARDRYYELNNVILENIKSSESYLQDDLMKDFDLVIGTIRTQIAKSNDTIKKLEGDGYFIKDRAQRVKELKLKELKEKMEAEKTPAQPVKEKKTTVEVAWYTHVLQVVGSFFSTIYDSIIWVKDSLFSLFSSSKAPAKPAAKKPDASTAPEQTAQTVMPTSEPVMPTTAQPTPPPADQQQVLPPQPSADAQAKTTPSSVEGANKPAPTDQQQILSPQPDTKEQVAVPTA